MTTAQWLGIIFSLVGMTAGLVAWVYAIFQTKESARLQERALDELMKSHRDNFKTEMALLRVDSHNAFEVMTRVEGKVDKHIEMHLQGALGK